MKTIIAVIFLMLTLGLVGCGRDQRATNSSDNIHRELWGSWSNEQGCDAKFTHRNKNLILSSFNNNRYFFKDIALTTQKNGIITYFAAHTLKFSGSYVEGALIIDNYCKEPLHKIGN